jgi:hypothetical protein
MKRKTNEQKCREHAERKYAEARTDLYEPKKRK